jgi:copper chaperone
METTISIKGMTCAGCVASVKRVLQGIDGVEKVDVSLDPPEAKVEYAAGRVDKTQLRTAIEDAGYEAVG